MQMSARIDALPRYAAFRPTAFDSPAHVPHREHWLVAPCSITRDSGVLDQSNWHAQLAALGGESETVEIHRFGHWGPGWFEIVLIDPADATAAARAAELTCALADYPIVDEDDHSRREYEAVCEAWENMLMPDRIYALSRAGLSIFAARRDDPFAAADGCSEFPYDLIDR